MKAVRRKIGLGSVQFGVDYGISNVRGKTPFDEVSKILDYALQNGIETIDTASAYGNAEEVLGKHNLNEFKVVSKFMPPDGSSVEEELEVSLQKLKLKILYGYLAHRPEALIKSKTQWFSLLRLREQGKVKKIGFSLNRPEELEDLLKLEMIPDLVQVPYNLFDRRFENQMIRLKEKSCEVHVRSTFLQGLFFMNPKVLPKYFDPVKTTLLQLQDEHGDKLSGALLDFVLKKDFIDAVIIGVENAGQLVQNIENLKMTEPISIEIPNIPDSILVPSLWPKS